MAREYKGTPSWTTMHLAQRNPSGQLLAAGAARTAAELGRKHNGRIPDTAITQAVAQFETWLRASCDAARTPAREPTEC